MSESVMDIDEKKEALKPEQGAIDKKEYPIPGGRGDSPVATGLSQKSLFRCMQNRELSWLRFNERVLEEADSYNLPLFEKLFYISVFTTNLNEFFMVRVGGFQSFVLTETDYLDNKTGMNAGETLSKVYAAVAALYPKRDAMYQKVESELAGEGIVRRDPNDLDEDEKALLKEYYETQVESLLAPQIVDKTHPFPHIENNRLVVAVSIEAKSGFTFGMIPLPRGVERIFDMGDGKYILLEDIILHYADRIFKKHVVTERSIICITRNADIDTLDEPFEVDEDYRDHVSKLLKKQKRLSPVRLEMQSGDCKNLSNYLQKKLSLKSEQVYTLAAPIDLSYHGALKDKVEPHLRSKMTFSPFEPTPPAAWHPNQSMFAQIRREDMFLSHPFESLQPFLALVKEAASDDQVISIHITLYRIADQSRLAESLIEAAENGKDVFVFIELRARMDEENNIEWAKRMEQAGCTVFYGDLGYKMHSKICLITRREAGKQQFITHIGTGNYNEKTAKLYTDLAIITADRDISKDAVRFFHNMMTGNLDDSYPTLWVAPREFKSRLIEYIGREAQLGAEGLITIKCNSLTDKDVIEALVLASMAGAKINLIIRGICCLVPGISRLTENISIRSIVGRYLEHSRIYRFGIGDRCELLIGSGDMMTRNTQRRTELFVSVKNQMIRERIFAMLDVFLHDNVKARTLTQDGMYIPVVCTPETPPLDSQVYFMEQAKAAESPTTQQSAPKAQTAAAMTLFERIAAAIRNKLSMRR